MDALNQTQQEMRFTTKPTISLEVFTIKMAQPVVAVAGQAAPTNQEYVSQLEQQLQSLQQQMSQLLQGQGVVAPKKATSTPQAKASTYKPNIGEVYKVLDAATRKDLIFIRELWGDLLQMLSTTQRALLKASEPVAASPNGFVLKFDYEILCQRAQESVELHEDIARHCQTLAQYPGNFVSVTGEQWVQIRQDYLRDKKEKQEAEGVTHATEMEEQPTDEEEKNEVEQLVQNTIDLFGEEIVHISEETENN